jgi:hypothetical protein
MYRQLTIILNKLRLISQPAKANMEPELGCYDDSPVWLDYGDKQCTVVFRYGTVCYHNQGRRLA